jgi:hypothetical protein
VRLPDVPEVSELAVLPVPLAPMEVLPLVLGLAAVEPLLVLVSVLGAAAAGALGVWVVEEPVAAPAAGDVAPPEADDPAVPEPVVLLPDVWAIDSPPMAKAAAAARVVRVFLVVVISNSLNGNPEGNRLKKASWPKSQLLRAYVSIRAAKSGFLQAQLVGPQLSRIAAQ